jgi:Ni/Fe-hydrogenase subunit HybB-like protein
MDPNAGQAIVNALQQVKGYIYPNELELQWGFLIVVYPYVTGLVAGAFILASLERVFKVHAIKPVYRMALLTALAFLLVAPMPLLFHLGHPERATEVVITPHLTSPMAMFGFVYAWYLMVVLLLEIWYDFRADIVGYSKTKPGWLGKFYGLLTLGVTDTSGRALAVDEKAGKFITIIGIPSAFFLHGYVGFIFGCIKANPWWSSVLMPVVFIFSAVVSGIALMLVVYAVTSLIRKVPIQMSCLDAMGKFLFFALILDFAMESLDWFHRFYEAEDSFDILVLLVSGKLFLSLVVIQVFMGTLTPLTALGVARLFKLPESIRKVVLIGSACLVLLGVFAVRWNVVIGGQLFSKSLAGFTTYKPQLIGHEGLLIGLILLVVPFFILWALVRLLPPWLPTTQKHSS